jgi:hypothetical protein
MPKLAEPSTIIIACPSGIRSLNNPRIVFKKYPLNTKRRTSKKTAKKSIQ